MGFADLYLNKQIDFKNKIADNPRTDLRFIVVIPCFNEPDVLKTLESLKNTIRTKSAAEVIIVINSSLKTNQEIIDQNKRTYTEVKGWIEQNSDSSLSFFVLLEENLNDKFAGAGLARKLGMDQAVARFNTVNASNGVIISLDADSTVKTDYLTEIEKHFNSYPKTNALSSYFEHPLEGESFDESIYHAISVYELYLRYYKSALKYSGFPYAFHTIGSCFSVSARAYLKQGGMNRKQAGEDFYFLHKIFPLGECYELDTSCVYPSPRISDRVPFGTGPMVKSIAHSKDPFLTYAFQSFLDLKSFFQQLDCFYKIDMLELNDLLYQLPLPVVDFLSQNEVHSALEEINKNSSGLKTFRKRFFNWFNAFMVLKYLNATAEKFYPKTDLLGEAEKLLITMNPGFKPYKNYKSYLQLFRQIEKGF